jgi:putative NIF3 family GTP cyclohydrolase 1 type 2
MTILELIKELDILNDAHIKRDWSVDTLKFGNANQELSCVAITMFPTAQVIQKAFEAGAELLIGHEPTFYCDDEHIAKDDSIGIAKKALLDQTGLAIFRYHDHPHWMKEDLIDTATIRLSKLKGEISGTPFWAVTTFALKETLTAKELASTLEKNLSTKHIRIAGTTNSKGKNIAFACGTPGHIKELLQMPEVDFVVTGEICEWNEGEYIRDLAYLTKNKAILVLGHEVSEKAGMMELATILSKKYNQFKTLYIESGDLYSYTD